MNLLSSKSELNKVTNTNNLKLGRVRREKKKKKSTLVSIYQAAISVSKHTSYCSTATLFISKKSRKTVSLLHSPHNQMAVANIGKYW